METKYWALLFIALAALFSFMFYSYDQAVSKLAANSCSSETMCPHEEMANTERIIIAVQLVIIFILIGALFFRESKQPAAQQEAHEHKRTSSPQDLGKLSEDEKRVFSIIQDKGGSVFQSDLIRETGFTKVKVSRLLDRLEHSGAIERKRRGMANIIVLK